MSKYKTPTGQLLTASLFYEQWYTLPDHAQIYDPVFSFDGRPGYINFRKSFVELNDVTGYEWAMKYLDSWEHFQKLLKAPWFNEQFEAAVQELETKWQQQAINKIREIAASEDTKQSLGAARYVAEQGWKKKSTRGRPSKAEIEQAKRDAVKGATDLKDDLERILQASKVKLVKK